MFDLRYYQQRLIDQAHAAWEKHQSTAIISATATGKTEVYMSLAVSEAGRVLVLVHRDYLINQPINRLAKAGFEDVAVEKADEKAELGFKRSKIVFASVQSIGPKSQEKRLKTFDPFKFSLVIVDEGHRATAETYRRVLDHFKRNPKVKVLILTATPNRKDGVALSNVCDSVAGVYGPSQAMREGWIVPVKFFRRDVQSLDFSNVKMRGTDLDADQVQDLLMQTGPLHEICASLADDRGPTIIFCPEVAIARAYESLMNDRYRPHKAKMLYADSPDDEREAAGKDLADGKIEYIFNVNLYVEGYDLPNLLRVVWASPTASLVRYVQGVGRVFRTHHCLRGHLNGGPENAEERRLLIAQSPKPFGIVVTYYPQNCKHELCDPVDILGGDELPSDIKAVAKKIQEDTSKQERGSTTEEDIETAKVFCEFRSVLDQRLKEVQIKAVYTDSQFDPMGGKNNACGSQSTEATRDAVAESWGNHEPASEKQVKWMLWKGVRAELASSCTKWRACVVRNLYDLGVPLDKALGWGKRQALKVMDEMKAKQTRKDAPIPE